MSRIVESNRASANNVMGDMVTAFISNFSPTSQVELSLSCRNLVDNHIVGKSDPFCKISIKESWEDQYFEIARTEVIRDSLNPQWVQKVLLKYNFETYQKICFEVHEEDEGSSHLLGFFKTTLSELVSHSGRQFIGKLMGNGRHIGDIVIVTEEKASCKTIAEIQFRAEDLEKSSWICRNDPFLVISRSNEDGSYSVVAKTEPVYETQNPMWKPFKIKAVTLCNGDFNRTVKIDCYDLRGNGNHKLIGTCYTSLRGLSSASPMLLMNEEKRKSEPNRGPSGILRVHEIRIIEDLTFLDYIRNGTQMHFAVAIDFTASNGVHTDPNSFHYLSSNPMEMNYYEMALRGVGAIIQHYDSAKLFPAFGFGARLPPNGNVSHQFPLNGNPSHPYCSSIEEILQHYRNQLRFVQLAEPTNLAPVINNTISIANQFQDGTHYFVLLIITDGGVNDMHQTKKAIINASSLPISIIIVGVGDTANFRDMHELDGDDVRLSVEGHYAERDIVQFVALNTFISHNGQNQCIKSEANLAKNVLAEIPKQLMTFMKSHGIHQTLSPYSSVITPTAPML